MNDKALYCVIDLKSFYASCECAARHLDIFSTPLVVCDPTRGPSTIVMSATPYLKKTYGVPNVCRRRDLPNVPNLILAQPRMAYYVEMSSRVVSIFLDFVDEADLHVYSIDESFLNIGPYLKVSHCTAEQYVAKIQQRIKDELGLVATAGIGPNMFLAKICLDNEGKKKPPYCAQWTLADIPTKLWTISPITEIWGISDGIERRLRLMGIRSVEGLARAKREDLEKQFGILGDQLHDLANGIDRTDIREKYVPKETHLSIGQELSRDYTLEEAKLILREMSDDLCLRLRLSGQKTGEVSLFIAYSVQAEGGFAHQMSLLKPTDDNDTIYQAILELFNRYSEPKPVRNLGLGFGKLGHYEYQQLDVFESSELLTEKKNLHKAIDKIQLTYGRNACLRLSSLTKASTIHERHQQIGGHKA
jgi:DNA polymerase V